MQYSDTPDADTTSRKRTLTVMPRTDATKASNTDCVVSCALSSPIATSAALFTMPEGATIDDTGSVDGRSDMRKRPDCMVIDILE